MTKEQQKISAAGKKHERIVEIAKDRIDYAKELVEVRCNFSLAFSSILQQPRRTIALKNYSKKIGYGKRALEKQTWNCGLV